MPNLTLGSLFDGSGGFPLGAILTGIEPLWASEVEPFAIRVTTRRFPDMKHLGDINKIDGAAVPPVDIVTFGSPCTDLSVAGKQAGIGGKQSSLFFQAIRIIKEMREATNGQSPRFIVWENVQGALGSRNAGRDFKAVLNAVVEIAEAGAEVPEMPPSGWPYADVLVGDGWSIAYRLLDSQHFGVAQRRRRVYLVADFAGERAADILFERAGVSRNFTPGGRAGQGTAGTAASGAGGAVVYDARGNGEGNLVNTITGDHENRVTDYTAIIVNATDAADREGCLTGWDVQSQRIFGPGGVSPTLSGSDGGGGRNPAGLVLSCPELARTLTARHDGSPCADRGANIVAAFMAGQGAKARGIAYSETISPTLKGVPSGLNQAPCAVVYGIGGYNSEGMLSDNPRSGIYEADIARTLDTGGGSPSCNQGGIAVVVMEANGQRPSHKGNGFSEENMSYTLNTVEISAICYQDNASGDNRYVVRRLTPQECALLQGFPPTWCADLETPEPSEEDISFWTEVFDTYAGINGTKSKSRNQIIKWLQSPHSDSAEYKMWGNGVSEPIVVFVLGGIAEVCREDT